jgi:hypothetical protein
MAWWVKRTLLFATGAAAAVLLTGCPSGKTVSATNVTSTSATLNGTIYYDNTTDWGSYFWEYSADGVNWSQASGGSIGDYSPTKNCTSPNGPTSFNVTKNIGAGTGMPPLVPSTHYVYRIGVHDCTGAVQYYDSEGVPGTNWSSFQTPPSPPPAGTHYLRPNVDITTDWVEVPEGPGWSTIDDNVTQGPVVPEEQFIYSTTTGQTSEVGFTTQPLNGGLADASKAWFYGNTAAHTNLKVEVLSNGVVRGSTTVLGGAQGADFDWRSINFTPTDQAAIDDLRMRFTITAGSNANVRAAYVELKTKSCPAGSVQPEIPVAPGKCYVRQIEDRATSPSHEYFWGDSSENNPSVYPAECDSPHNPRLPSLLHQTTGGDTHNAAGNLPVTDTAFRWLTVETGDAKFGYRCELGQNEMRSGYGPNSVFYREGDHVLTYMSVWLHPEFPLDFGGSLQGVMQMKQTFPSEAAEDGNPPLSIGAYQGRWQLYRGDLGQSVWDTPATVNRWTRFIWDVTYSVDGTKGLARLYVDLNGDGDYIDGGEQSPTLGEGSLNIRTLTPEIPTPPGETPIMDGIDPGEPIPTHLRAGIYRADENGETCEDYLRPEAAYRQASDPAPPDPVACTIGIDNVQIVRAQDP